MDIQEAYCKNHLMINGSCDICHYKEVGSIPWIEARVMERVVEEMQYGDIGPQVRCDCHTKRDGRFTRCEYCRLVDKWMDYYEDQGGEDYKENWK